MLKLSIPEGHWIKAGNTVFRAFATHDRDGQVKVEYQIEAPMTTRISRTNTASLNQAINTPLNDDSVACNTGG